MKWKVSRNIMKNFTELMNKPIEYTWTEEEIREEFKKVQDEKKMMKIFKLSKLQLRKILERE